MASECEAGLFVGVDGYPGLPEDRVLKHASVDARRLAAYFRQARHDHDAGPERQWECLAEGPTRQAILKGVSDLATRVASGGVGLFYFAGHAANHPGKGLVLQPGDFDPNLPDTGVPLRAVFDLLRAEARKDRTFLVVLDCCRGGEGDADDIPQNVCALFSCAHDSAAEEARAGGLLSRAFEMALRHHAEEVGDQIPCTLRRFHARLKTGLLDSLGAPNPRHEFHGGHADRIALPLVLPRDRSPAPARTRPAAVLRTGERPGKPLLSLRDDVAGFLRAWFQLADAPDRDRWLPGPSLQVSETEGWLELHLPDDTQFWEAREFLELLLKKFYADFYSLVITWPRPIPKLYFRALQERLPESRQWELARGGVWKLSWRNRHREGETLGHLYLEHPTRDITQICIICQHPVEPEPLPLSYLWPSLGELFERLRLAVPPPLDEVPP